MIDYHKSLKPILLKLVNNEPLNEHAGIQKEFLSD